MDRKGSRDDPRRASRPKKRHFPCNRHTFETDTSATKLRKLDEDQEVSVNMEHSYIVLNFLSFFSLLSTYIICRDCHKTIKFSKSSIRGLGMKIVLECDCDPRYVTTSPLINQAYDINRRLVFVMRLLGVGLQGIKLFCGLMDLSSGLTNNLYYGAMNNIVCASKLIFEIVLRKAVQEEQEKNENPDKNCLTVSGDGTWKKRGFRSLFGVAILIGKYSNKVVDAVVKSSFCKTCNNWKEKKDTPEYEDFEEQHEVHCTKNNTGNAGKIEVDAIVEMFRSSEEKYGVKYTTYIGDGDSETFKSILNAKPYDNIVIKKKECVSHAEKRMSTRLRNLKKADNDLGEKGVGELTGKVISDLTTGYGLAIRRNPESIEAMKNDIWATYYHYGSSDEKPQHHFCPPGPESWCNWRKSEADGTLGSFHHENPPLSEKVLEAIKPIYESLITDELLERYLGSNTENNNESLNSLIWTLAPKHLHSGKETVEFATYLAVCIFNEGFTSILQMMKQMGVTIGNEAYSLACKRDENRTVRSKRRSLAVPKKAGSSKRSANAEQQEIFEVEEGLLYGT